MLTSFRLDELTKPLTLDEVKKSYYDVLTILGVVTTNWVAISVLRILVTAFAVMHCALSQLVANAVKGGFIDLADGEWIALNAEGMYDVAPITATFATTPLQYTNAGGGNYSGDPGDLVARNSATNATYTNTESFVIGPGGTGTIEFRADIAGSGGNAAIGEIDSLVTVLTNVTVTNDLPAIGLDDEDPQLLRQRAKQKLGALSPNGPTDAYAYIAKTATREDGTNLGITRVRTIPDANRDLNVYLATASGAVDSGDVDIANEAIQTQCVPLTVTATVASASTVDCNMTFEIWCSSASGLDSDSIAAAIELRLTEYLAQAPIGGYRVGITSAIWASELSAIAARATTAEGNSILAYRIVWASPDHILTPGQVGVMGTLTPTINIG